MTDYISREAALAIFGDVHPLDYNAQAYKYSIEKLPAADVVEVVRCKDCIHSYEDLCGRVCSYGVSVDCVVPDDFFCADGSRGGKNAE